MRQHKLVRRALLVLTLAVPLFAVNARPAAADACSVRGIISIQAVAGPTFLVHSTTSGVGCAGHQIAALVVPNEGAPATCEPVFPSSPVTSLDCIGAGVGLTYTYTTITFTVTAVGLDGSTVVRAESCATLIEAPPNFGGCTI